MCEDINDPTAAKECITRRVFDHDGEKPTVS